MQKISIQSVDRILIDERKTCQEVKWKFLFCCVCAETVDRLLKNKLIKSIGSRTTHICIGKRLKSFCSWTLLEPAQSSAPCVTFVLPLILLIEFLFALLTICREWSFRHNVAQKFPTQKIQYEVQQIESFHRFIIDTYLHVSNFVSESIE